jgi:membrane associated rhomboid family serine protease
MLFPIGDDNRHLASPAYISLALIAANLIVFFVFQGAGSNPSFIYGWSVIPQEITSNVDLVASQTVSIRGEQVQIPQAPGPQPIYLTILTAMFMHGGYGHLFGNLLYLWIFGDNVEDRLGSVSFLGFYLLCGVAATVAQIALEPDGVVPNLGASGAISGVLGAYIVFFPRNRVHALLFYIVVSVPAFVAIGLWIVFQFFSGIGSIAATETAVGGIAYGAHIGGFIAGVAVAGAVRLFGSSETPSPRQELYSRYEDDRGW